jgi:hypothetical protein
LNGISYFLFEKILFNCQKIITIIPMLLNIELNQMISSENQWIKLLNYFDVFVLNYIVETKKNSTNQIPPCVIYIFFFYTWKDKTKLK